MKKYFIFFIAALFCSVINGQDEEKPIWEAKWSNGAQINRSDGKFKIKFGGRVQFDVMNIWQNTSLDNEFEAENGAEFRRIRLYSSGTIYGNIKF